MVGEGQKRLVIFNPDSMEEKKVSGTVEIRSMKT